jgi:hypothetical protein
MVELTGKCVEGLQMNWENYLINDLEKDSRKAQDLGYEFDYSWLIILIAFVAWQITEGATFSYIEPTESLTAQFSTLWYTNEMMKQWQSNAMFHIYYQQLKVAIESFPHMTLCTLH